MMRVLITGANGFIGSHLVRACVARGDEVTALVRPGSGIDRLAEVSSDIHVHRVVLTDTAAVAPLFHNAQPDLVFHAAAKTRIPNGPDLSDAPASLRENVDSILSVLSAAAECETPPGAFVRLGTIAEYGDNPVPYLETQCEKPRDSYGTSMLTGTKYLEMLQPRLPFPAVTARLSLTYGPGQTGQQLVPYLIESLLTNKPAQIGRPDDARDLLYVDDAVRGLLMLGSDPKAAGPVVNISTGVATKVRDVAKMVQRLSNAPEDLLQFGSPTGAPIDLINHPGLMQSSYDWAPETNVQDGLKQTVEWAMRAQATLTGSVS
ncbi:NAD(P)-dependent oxidoreductase [Ruegeria sp. SCPT10]|uniref:NAD-dependent epimerase/dehydratase family protein n=1 Tax=Ruegeria sp. SCP10 TaxID=3141377 RepID=UPI00333C5BEA